MKATKRNKFTTAFCLVVLCVVIGVLAISAKFNFAYAEVSSNTQNLIEICKSYTEDVQHNGINLLDYKEYVNRRFQPDISVEDTTLWDEQIMTFVPERLFQDKKEEFTYIGEKYGFYFDYDLSSDSYFIFLIRNDWDPNISGHLSRKISPIYYERYRYDSNTGKAALIYREETPGEVGLIYVRHNYYERYSDVKKLFMKDVTFTGHLYNENHPNIDEAGYDKHKDNGGYFIGGSYQFNGVTKQEGKFDFAAEIFKIGVGYIPKYGDLIGLALDVADVISAAQNFAVEASKDFRDEVTNIDNHDFTMYHVLSEAQIMNYGNLLKDFVDELKTPNNAHGLLLKDNTHYANATFYYDFANDKSPWDTIFKGKIKLDIVEEYDVNGIETEIRPYKTIESLESQYQISSGEKITVTEGEHALYAFPLKEQKLNFTAPQNGEFTFETLGSVKNEFHAAKGTVTEKTDQTNQVLKVYLKKGERFEFATKNLTNAIGRYNITVSYTPTEVKIGENKTVDVAPGETEYFIFHYNELNPFTYSFDSTLNAEFAIHEGTPLAAPIFEYYDLEATGSYYKNYATKFYFSVKNNTADTLTANLGLSESKQLIPGQAETSDFIDNCIYKINPQVGSKFNITANAINSVKVYLYDQNMEEVYFSDSATTHSLDFVFKGNDIYFIKVVNAALGTNNFSLTLTYRPEQVTFGDNSITKPLGSYLYRFHSTADAEYRIVAGNAQVNIFGNDGTKIEPVNGMYRFLDNSDYYFKLEGSTTEITIGIDSTVNTNGNLSANGFVFVRFIPNLSYHYRFETSLPYQIYNRNLIPTSSRNMTKKETYYVRLNGEANQAYSIIINLDTVILSTYACQNVSAGYYSFDVSVTDEYNFFIYRNDGSTIELKYGNDIENLNTAITHKMKKTFSPGKYYVKVEGAGFATVVMETKNQSATGKTDLHLGQKQTIDLKKGNVNTLEFTNDIGLQTFRLTNESLIAAECEIHIFQKDSSSRKDVVIEKTEEKNYWELELGNGTYVFVIYCILTNKVTNALLELFIPNQLNGVYFGNSYVDFSNASNPSIELRMGVKYSLSFDDTDYASHQIGIEITGDNYVLQDYDLTFNVEEIPYNRAIILEDDDTRYYINLVLVFPYSAEASIEDYYFGASIKSLVSGETPIGYEYVETTFLVGTKSILTKSKTIDLAGTLIFNQECSMSCTVRIRIGNDFFSLKTNTVNFKNEVISLSALNGSESARLYIDASSASNKTINIGSNVRALFLMGSTSVTHNVKFVFPNVSTFTLYTSNFNNISDKGGVFYGPNTSLKWYNEGTSSFLSNGKYVVELKRIELRQISNSSSSIKIQGVDGGNSSNGTSGMYLHDTLGTWEYSGNLEIIGGKGVDGQNGDNGSDGRGAAGMALSGNSGGDGKSGTNGKNGGHGLIVVNNFNVNSTKLICKGGNGGNGGNGGTGGNASNGNVGWDSQAGSGHCATSGGSGGDGGNGGNGGAGGRGGNALIVVSLVNQNDYSGVTCVAGKGGKGGNAGNGGNGGKGGNGGSDHNFWSDKYDCHCGGNGGNGGNSGQAAKGGYNGLTVTGNINNFGSLSENNGSYGKAGSAGAAGGFGSAGAAGSPNNCEKGQHRPGKDGFNGSIIKSYIYPTTD